MRQKRDAYVKRKKDIVIRFRHYSQDTPLGCKRVNVLLCVTFNKKVGLLDGNFFVSLYETHLSTTAERQQHYTHGSDYDRIMETARLIVQPTEEDQPSTSNNDAENDENDPQVITMTEINYEQDMDVLQVP